MQGLLRCEVGARFGRRAEMADRLGGVRIHDKQEGCFLLATVKRCGDEMDVVLRSGYFGDEYLILRWILSCLSTCKTWHVLHALSESRRRRMMQIWTAHVATPLCADKRS